ncbi:serine hydrolase domain-containing protein [Chloroflexota bacterium]
MKKAILSISFLLLSLLLISCQSAPSVQYNYQPPEDINDGLDVGTLEEVNIDSGLMEKLVNEINRGKYDEVHSLLIVKDNKLAFEEYFPGHKFQWDAPKAHGELVNWDKSMKHMIMSDTKSITSVCIGIAIDEGFIGSVHQSMFDYLPEYQYLNTDGKDKITIEHLLTMTSGLKWDEWNAPPNSEENDIAALWFYSSNDPMTSILKMPLTDTPGTSFTYSGGNMIILSEIIKSASGMNLGMFSEQYLFQPLGIGSAYWDQFENGVIDGAGGLHLSPRDMAKIGVTFLNNGFWDGKRIISEQWVNKSATSFPGNDGINVPGTDERNTGYSYTWWTKSFSDSVDIYYAGGWGGQLIIVTPELNTVIVLTGGNYEDKVRIFDILTNYVIPAIN